MKVNREILLVANSPRFGFWFILLLFAVVSRPGSAQDDSSKSWNATTQQGAPNGSANPIRTRQTHTEVDGHIVDKTITETLGPDGRYVPYSETEKETVRVNDTTTRQVERTYGRNSDGQRTLTQQMQEESRSLPDGEKTVVRTTSNPDTNGGLQTVRRELVDSKQVSPGVRDTKTTVYSPDGNGGLSASVQIQERERRTDATTVEYQKSTSLADGAGHWTVSEVREGTTTQQNGTLSKDERVLRPDSSGKMTVVERTVTEQAAAGPGEQRSTTETYSTNVAGQAGDEGLRLVRRESTIQRSSANGGQSKMRQIEQPNPGDPSAGVRVTQEAIDIVRAGASGTATQSSTILTSDSNVHMNTVWVDMGQTTNPATVKVDTAPPSKPK